MGTKLNKKFSMRVVIALIVLIAMSQVSTQVPKKWLCCKHDNMYEPRWDVSCAGSGRRMQTMVEQYCPKRLTSAKRILEEVTHPVAPTCTNFNAAATTTGRRLQAPVVYKCPVNIEAIQCFKNNTNKACVQPAAA